MSADQRISPSAARLRRDFDAGFAAPVRTEWARLEDVLAIRVGGDAYALRLSEIAGLYADRKPTELPDSIDGLLGIVAIRGLLVPAYELAVLLGYPPATRARWLVLVRAPQPVGLAFAQFEAHLRLPEASFAQQESGIDSHRTSKVAEHVRGSVRTAGVVRPLIHVAGVLATVGKLTRARAASPGENNG